MRASSFGIATACFALALTFSSGAFADDAREQSRAAFRRGVTAAKENNYVAARDAFIEAYRLFAHPSILLNLGIAHAKTGELVDAEQELTKFLADDGGATPEEVKSAQRTLADVRDKLGTIALEVKPAEAKATLDGKPIALLSGQVTSVRAVAGKHALHIEAEGHNPYDAPVEVLSKIETPLKVELVSNVSRVSPPAEQGSGGGVSRTALGFTLLGVGVACGGAATFLGLRTLSLQSDWEAEKKLPASDRDTTIQSRGRLSRTLTDVAIGAAVVTAGVGAYFLLVKPSPKSSASAGVFVGATEAGVRGRF